MKHTSVIEISKSALKNNIRFLKSMLSEDSRLSSVVKGNAYGHNIEVFVPLAESFGIDHFSVYSVYEAYRVRKHCGPDTEIMIMGMIDHEELHWAIDNGISFFVFEPSRLDQAISAAERVGKKARIHLEVETGMNRTGIQYSRLDQYLNKIEENGEFVSFEGLCTHYAGAESIANYVRVKNQYKVFKKASERVKQRGLKPLYEHTACSAAAIRYPKTHMDLSRIGILQYGYWPSREVFIEYVKNKEDKKDPLEQLISWKSWVMDTKVVETGEFIGYGTSYLANETMRVATVPIGYSHGFSRSLSNVGRVLIHGKRVPVIGIVNMNAMMIDITSVPEARLGAEVVMIGSQGDLNISVSSFGQYSDQLNYELLTRLPQDIPRHIVK